jgi:hypothetical protein
MYQLKNKNQLDATYYFIVLLIGLTCFEHYYAHHQELTTIMLISTLVVSFSKDGRGSVDVELWFLVVCVRCEVVGRSVVLFSYHSDARSNTQPYVVQSFTCSRSF